MPDYQPDYKQATVTGQSWQRCLHVECNNPFEGQQTIRFDEENRVLLANGTTFGTPIGEINYLFTDPNVAFPLLDPTTGADTGQTVTDGFVYAVLWSKYRAEADKRDRAALAAEEESGVKDQYLEY